MERVTIAYNEATGKIVAMSLGEETDFKQTLLNDQPYLNQLGINNPETLTTMIVEVDRQTFSPSEYYIRNGELSRLNRIVLSTDALDSENPNGVPEIKGDGISSCELVATVLSADGNVNEQFAQPMTFRTSRGRLSARNGIAQAEAGVAKITLTSAPETVPPFEIRVEAEGCIPGMLKIEFY
jgi:hypothetical protein